MAPDISFFAAERARNKAFLVFAGASATAYVTNQKCTDGYRLGPYVDGGLGVVYADLSARSLNISTKRVVPSVNVGSGWVVSRNVRLESRYRWVPDIKGIALSGWEATFSVRF